MSNPILKINKINNNQKTTVVLLHGYGANAEDLAGLADYVPFSKNVNWSFIEAPFELAGNMYMKSYSWFDLNEELFTSPDKALVYEKMANLIPNKYNESMEMLLSTFREVLNTEKNIVLGGFSQGSMMALQLFNNLSSIDQKQINSLTLFSSIRFNVDNITENKTFPVFQSHGRIDEVLPFDQASLLKNILEKKYNLEFVEFNGGHQIPMDVLQSWSDFVNKTLEQTQSL